MKDGLFAAGTAVDVTELGRILAAHAAAKDVLETLRMARQGAEEGDMGAIVRMALRRWKGELAGAFDDMGLVETTANLEMLDENAMERPCDCGDVARALDALVEAHGRESGTTLLLTTRPPSEAVAGEDLSALRDAGTSQAGACDEHALAKRCLSLGLHKACLMHLRDACAHALRAEPPKTLHDGLAATLGRLDLAAGVGFRASREAAETEAAETTRLLAALRDVAG